MKFSLLPPSLLLYISVLIPPTRCALDVDFAAYPSTTQICLDDTAKGSNCSGDTVFEINNCLCNNGGNFVLDSAACIGNQGTDIMTRVYELMQSSCSGTETPLTISEAEWMAAGSISTSVVTSTVTTTSANHLATYTTTYTTSTHVSSETAVTSTSSTTITSSNSSGHELSDYITLSAKIGAITAGVASVMMAACIVCVLVLLKKRKRDKALLQKALEAAQNGGRDRGNDKPLLDPGSMTPGFPSPMGPWHGRDEQMFGASVAPPTPSHRGPGSPQVWRSHSQSGGRGTATSPSELGNDHPVYELSDSRIESHHTHWPSPVSQEVGTMGSWCPSPMSAMPTSNALGMYRTATHPGGGISGLSSPLSRQITGLTARSTWTQDEPLREHPLWDEPVQEEPVQEELYELPGNEVTTGSPVEADSIPVRIAPERLSMTIGQAPPQYTRGEWNDPITDKPPM